MSHKSFGKVSVSQENGDITVRAGKTTLMAGRNDALSLDLGSGELFNGDPFRPNLYRPLTDNDRGYFNFVPQFLKWHPFYRWRKAQAKLICKKCSVRQDGDTAVVTMLWKAPMTRGLQTVWTIYPDGAVHLSVSGKCSRKLELLRFGVRVGLKSALCHAKWYGRGPYEAYRDRKTGQRVAIHVLDADQMPHLYVRPQENGNRTDVRYVEITDDAGHGVRITADAPMDFSLLPFSQEKLDAAEHIHELEPDDYLSLHLDAMQCGVGGDQPGVAALHPEYKMLPGKYAFGCTWERV